MKNKKGIFTALAFALAIGSAFASDYFGFKQGFTNRTEVPDNQPDDCLPREFCVGIDTPCTMVVGSTIVNLYDGSVQTPTLCGVWLKEN